MDPAKELITRADDERPKGKTFRRLGLATATVGVAVAGYALEVIPPVRAIDSFLAKHGIVLNTKGKKLQALDEELLRATLQVVAAIEKGEVNTDMISSLKTQHEWVQFVNERSGIEPDPFDPQGEKFYQAFEDAVSAEIDKLPKVDPDTSPVELLARLKKAYDAVQEGSAYNKEFALMFDAFMPGEDGKVRSQCRSGTHALMTLARELLPGPDKHHVYVYVYTAGHVLPGIMFRESEDSKGKVVAFETTTKGGRVEFDLDNLPKGVTLRVTNALSEDLYQLMPPSQRPKKEDIVLFSNVPPRQESKGRSSLSSGGGSPFGFGSVDVPEGDQERSSSETVSPETYGSRGGVFGSSGSGGGAATGGGGASTQLGPEFIEIEKALDGQDLAAFKDYISHAPELTRYYNMHVKVANNDSLTNGQKAARIERIRRQARQYIDENGVVGLYRTVAAALNQRDLRFSGNTHPVGIYNVIVNNAAFYEEQSKR